ncbi:MAG: methylmalonyl-CoA epimerase [Candidatus Delongbacteria bacterium]|nr:methylmalonyl-CoA epimerase [Candidatus Delongbacteria bacterium]MBN2833830.1 methylmalonyl-CoA epimerase [Candidatus Delongbacteria bacterium]
MSKLKKINHVGIAVSNLEEAAQKYVAITGEADYHTEYVEDQDVLVAMFHVGESKIELLQGKSERSPISKFLEKNREGLHHICYEVENVEQAINELKEQGYKLIDEVPRIGAGGHRIAFIHPKSTQGVLTELLEKKK